MVLAKVLLLFSTLIVFTLFFIVFKASFSDPEETPLIWLSTSFIFIWNMLPILFVFGDKFRINRDWSWFYGLEVITVFLGSALTFYLVRFQTDSQAGFILLLAPAMQMLLIVLFRACGRRRRG